MSRQPADKLAKSKDPVTRDQLWNVMKGYHGEWFTVSMLFAETYAPHRTLSSYLACLCAGNYAEKRAGNPHPEYRIIKDSHFAPRLRPDGSVVTQGGGTENMWRTMRMMKSFTARDIAAHATAGDVKVSEQTAKTYLRHLQRAGYLRILHKGHSHQQRIYKLVRNTGPKPPMIQRVKRVFDQNLQQVFELEDAA